MRDQRPGARDAPSSIATPESPETTPTAAESATDLVGGTLLVRLRGFADNPEHVVEDRETDAAAAVDVSSGAAVAATAEFYEDPTAAGDGENAD
ncbi:MAG: hypothetical protein ABEJ79_04305 [Halolamina sp.]